MISLYKGYGSLETEGKRPGSRAKVGRDDEDANTRGTETVAVDSARLHTVADGLRNSLSDVLAMLMVANEKVWVVDE